MIQDNDLQWSNRVASRCGVYMLMLAESVQYIGKSVDMDLRVSEHRREGRIDFDGVRMSEVAEERLDVMERELIVKHDPPFNVTHTSRAKGRPRKSMYGETEKLRTTVYLSKEMQQKLAEVAERHDRNRNNMICCLVVSAWERMKGLPQSNPTMEELYSPTPKQ